MVLFHLFAVMHFQFAFSINVGQFRETVFAVGQFGKAKCKKCALRIHDDVHEHATWTFTEASATPNRQKIASEKNIKCQRGD